MFKILFLKPYKNNIFCTKWCIQFFKLTYTILSHDLFRTLMSIEWPHDILISDVENVQFQFRNQVFENLCKICRNPVDDSFLQTD